LDESRSHLLSAAAIADLAFSHGCKYADGAPFAIRGDMLLHWTPDGYDARESRPRGIAVDVLTPPAMIGILLAGYEPRSPECNGLAFALRKAFKQPV
jgi:hypothetical protein